MACNCASQKQINKLYELYGDKSNKVPKTLWDKIKDIFEKICVYTIIFLLSPLLIGFVLYKLTTKEKQISVRKLLGFKSNEIIDAAIAKNIIENTNIVDNNESEQ